MQTKESNTSKSTDPERNGPPHSNSNGAAIGGTTNQVPGVGRGAGGPGDGQGPGLGAGQGLPQKNNTPVKTEDDNTPFIHPEPPTNTPETQTDASAASTNPTTDPERNGPPHSNSNGAAVGGTANQVPGVGRGAGGPGDGQGPGLGAGQGLPPKNNTPVNADRGTPSDEAEPPAIQNPQNTGNQTHDDTPFIHPEPPTNTTETQTNASTASTDPTTDPEHNGPTHSNSNDAAVGGTSNQDTGVSQGTGGPSDGQGPGLGAGQGLPPKNNTPVNADRGTPSDEAEPAAIQNPHNTGNQTHDNTLFIHPEPPTNTTETQTDASADSTDPTEPAGQPQNINQLPSENSSTNNPEPPTTAIQHASTQTNATKKESLPSQGEGDLIQDNGLFEVNHSACNNKILQIDLTAATRNINRLSFVKVDYDPLTGVSIDGQKANNSETFRELIQDNLVDPNGSEIYIGGNTERTIWWNLNCVDAGHYAPVMITKSGEILTLGSAADGREHVLISGGDTFNFEDLMSYQNSDWDYNDLTVKLTET